MRSDRKRPTRFHEMTQRLQDPLQLRVFIASVILAIGYAGAYLPLEARITETTQSLRKVEELKRLTEDIEQLRAQVARVSTRVPEDTDKDEWLQYILGGIRKHAVTMVKLHPNEVKKVGPFEAVVMQVELRGPYHDLESFLDWIENNERLFRIDSISIAPMRGVDQLEMKLTILGLRG